MPCCLDVISGSFILPYFEKDSLYSDRCIDSEEKQNSKTPECFGLHFKAEEDQWRAPPCPCLSRLISLLWNRPKSCSCCGNVREPMTQWALLPSKTVRVRMLGPGLWSSTAVARYIHVISTPSLIRVRALANLGQGVVNCLWSLGFSHWLGLWGVGRGHPKPKIHTPSEYL